eukprot:COSAG04_NODE_26769_length_291_cov_0.562500_1_plen_52_part_01
MRGPDDLAFPDNEHLSTATYGKFLGEIVAELQKKATKAKLLWVATTPVPTDP